MTTWALAVDLGGTKVEAALVDSTGVVLTDSRFRAPTGSRSTSEQLAASVDSVIRQARAALPAGGELLGVGIGTAGPITVSQGLVSPSTCRVGATTPCWSKCDAFCPMCP